MSTDSRSLQELDPQEFFFLPLGIGNAFTRKYFNASILMICGGHTVVVDAPAPMRRVLADAERRSGFALDLHIVDSMFITHLHADHCNGIEEFAFWRMFFAPQLGRPRLAVHADMKEALWNHSLYAGMGGVFETEGRDETRLEHFFDVIPYRAGDRLDFGIPGFALEPVMVKHLIPTAGFKATFGPHKLGYSSDTRFFPELFEFFEDCDVIIHEVGHGPGHTAIENLMELPQATRDRILLFHVPDDLDVESSPLPVLEEGKLYQV